MHHKAPRAQNINKRSPRHGTPAAPGRRTPLEHSRTPAEHRFPARKGRPILKPLLVARKHCSGYSLLHFQLGSIHSQLPPLLFYSELDL